MPTKTFYSKLLLLAILMTFIAIGMKDMLPKRTLSIVPNSQPDANYFLIPVNNDPEQKKAFWVNRDKYHFHCNFTENDTNPPCNFIFMLSVDSVHGTNLQNFQGINLDIKYAGNSKKIRLGFRDYDASLFIKGDDNSTKFNSINIRTSDLSSPIYIALSELKVADWWISMYNLPLDKTHPDVSNAITLALDFEGDLRNSEHDIQINKIEFVGDWITTEHWYLGILLLWLASGTIYTLVRLIHLQAIERASREKISDLVVSNAQLRTETDKFRKLSTVDALTNAFNRHGIEQIIESLDFRLETTSIIMMDLDYFKRINDRRGHDAGDRVLQKISEIVLKRTRSTDKFGRWGGEEFILICPNTSIGMATALAEKLRMIIFDTAFDPEKPLSVTASFGVAAVHKNEPFYATIKRADEALYEAKSLGRNCVVIAAQDKFQ